MAVSMLQNPFFSLQMGSKGFDLIDSFEACTYYAKLENSVNKMS